MPFTPERKAVFARTYQKMLEELEREWDEQNGETIIRGSLEMKLLSDKGLESSSRAAFMDITRLEQPLPPVGRVVLVSWDDAGIMFGRRTDTGDTIWPGGWETRSSLDPVDVWRPGRKPDKWCPLPEWIRVPT